MHITTASEQQACHMGRAHVSKHAESLQARMHAQKQSQLKASDVVQVQKQSELKASDVVHFVLQTDTRSQQRCAARISRLKVTPSCIS